MHNFTLKKKNGQLQSVWCISTESENTFCEHFLQNIISLWVVVNVEHTKKQEFNTYNSAA